MERRMNQKANDMVYCEICQARTWSDGDGKCIEHSMQNRRKTRAFIGDTAMDEILSMEDLERWHIKKVLDKNRWDRTQTANQLGISPKTLYTKIKKYELKPI